MQPIVSINRVYRTHFLIFEGHYFRLRTVDRGGVSLANAALQVDDGGVVINDRLVLGADIIPVLEDAA